MAFGYIIIGGCDGFGNDIYIANEHIYLNKKQAIKVADKMNKKEGIESATIFRYFENREDAIEAIGLKKVEKFEKESKEFFDLFFGKDEYIFEEEISYDDFECDLSLHEYYKHVQESHKNIQDIDSVCCYVPVQLKIK